MNEHPVNVIRITPDMVHKHENADTLSVVTIEGYTVCTQTNDIPEGGGLAAYIEPDSLVNTTRPEFAFLRADARFDADSVANKDGDYARIRVKKLRGVPSMGLLVWLNDVFVEGEDISAELDVWHYEPPVKLQKAPVRNEPPGYHPTYSSIENFKKASAISDFINGETVVATEKIHGANARYTIDAVTGELCVGSHKMWLRSDEPSAWLRAVEACPGVLSYLKDNPGDTVYGELFGPAVQGPKASYGEKDLALVVFDILKPNGAFIDYQDLLRVGMAYNIRLVPPVYIGQFDTKVLTELAEGLSPTHEETVMEGLVIKPLNERRGRKFNRVMVKLISNRYYLKKSE